MLAALVSLLTTVLTLASLAFCCVALWAARAFAHQPRPGQREPYSPPVSILKPLKGLDPGLYEALASHCRQSYDARFEMLLGLADPGDPAAAVIEQLRRDFPACDLRVIACPHSLGANGKISNLAQMLPHARYEHILISDADITVSPHYLGRILSEFGPEFAPQAGRAAPLACNAGASNPGASLLPSALPDPRFSSGTLAEITLAAVPPPPVGLVTAPYRGRSYGLAGCDRPTLGSRLEALSISTDFFPGVLTARLLEGGVHFGLGSTLATTQAALAAMGGLETLLDHLADDYQMGARLARAGYRVILSSEVVETSVPPYSMSGFWAHQLRWARSMRDSRPAGYVGLALTYALPWALLNLLASGLTPSSAALLSLALAARIAGALAIGVGILGDTQVLRDLWLLPLRDCLGLALWAWSYAEDTVLWRGERLRLHRGLLTREP